MKTPLFVAAVVAIGLAPPSPTAAQTCGNFVREAGEQCDDGNTRNLDGCDSTCHFEQTHRINALKLQSGTDGTCASNAFGGAFGTVALTQVQNGLDTAVANGVDSILLHFQGLDDLAGVDDPSLQVGLLSATPLQPGSVAYNGTSDADWWYAADPGMTDAQHLPVSNLPAALAAQNLSAGPGNALLNVALAGTQTVPVAFSSTTLTLHTGNSSTPAAATGRLGPGHEPYEHLDPALQTFATGGVANTNWGTLCGGISAASLAAIPVPQPLAVGGIAACTQNYTTGVNSLLDVLVGGCTFFGTLIFPTQPDLGDPNTPDAGTGPPYTLSSGNLLHVIDTCRDSTNNVVPLGACLADAAYSSHWKFTTDRVIVGDDRLLADGFESGTLAAWSSAATDNGDLSVSPAAALNGTTQGLQGVVNDTNSLFVRDDGPQDEDHYRARFWLEPHAFDPGEASGHFRTRVFIGFEENPTRRVFAVVLKRQAGVYSVEGRARLDNDAQADTGFVPIEKPGDPAVPHVLAVEWIRSSGPSANDGIFRFSLDGTVVGELTGLANSVSSIDFVRLGALSVKSGASGTLDWDEFVSRRRGAVN